MKTLPPKTFFSFDPEDGFEIHSTAEEARARAEKILRICRDEACEGWNDDVTQVCWGKVTQRVREKWRKTKPPVEQLDEDGMDADGNDWSHWDELVEYHLADTEEPKP